ncbi:MAG: cobalamin-dependent protein [Elusimicrobia bacterium]|nr:cobalamin-dependent protein [Elusimicrobiota bacterium]
MKRLLLTSICRPLGPKHGDGPSVGYELLFGQVTRAQGIFSPRAVHHHFSLEYIAANIKSPTVVLQYPSKKELIRELKKGYDYVGLSFILSTFHRMKEIVALIREHSPKSKIILGGYGTVLGEEYLKPYGDHICRGEGVEFMRNLLGEEHQPGPYQHPLIVSKLKVFGQRAGNTGMIFAGLGCPNGCDFCCTSHFFKRQHVKLLPTGRDIYNVVERYLDMDPHMSFTVIDEDFLLDKQRAMEFHDLVVKSGRPLSIFAFASIKALSQYKIEELLEMGIDGVWIGYEGTRSGYEKRAGRSAEEVFRELREHGVTILASMIVGFDYQDEATVASELDGLLAMKPSFTQFLIYGPTPGTPYWERVVREGRLREDLAADPELYCRNASGFTSMVKHPKLSAAQIEKVQRRCFAEDYRRLGPSIYRTVEAWLNGYLKLKDSANPMLAKKAAVFARDIRKAYPIFKAGLVFGPNRNVRRWIAELERRVHAVVGAPTAGERLTAWAGVGAAAWTQLQLKLDLFQHPELKRTAYRQPGFFWASQQVWGSLAARFKARNCRMQVEFLHARHEVWLKIEGKLSGSEAERMWRDLGQSLERCRCQVILDFKRCRWDEKSLSPEFRAKLAEYRDRVRVVLPKLQHAHPELLILAKMFHEYKGGFGL